MIHTPTHISGVAAATKSLQLCPTLVRSHRRSPPGSPVPGILQARTLEWVTISFSNAWKWKGKVKSFSHVRLLETPWTAAYQAPPSMGFSRQEHWSGVPLPSPTSLARSNSMTPVFIILSSAERHITLTFAEWLLQCDYLLHRCLLLQSQQHRISNFWKVSQFLWLTQT